ncbi:LysM domain protein [Aspergillus costaricaensis CBS 115574]|uniref:LysM domain protein n=1 Tax=Aspergillus costaricaensis CBS 115574 TaxID=1448317 RepID=A0ACD1IIE5_9EURO|nr:LysM domain protein [Aspergillus costaricaensis CBS 115574]RAK90215.1 LysM domain protein [Aspergillus costaricaensis CBS 115574]
MISTPFFTLAIFASVHGFAINKRFDNGDFPTGNTDPNVASACTYWANSIASTDTCADLESYYGITATQLTFWNPSLSITNCALKEGWSYCVSAPAISTTPSFTSTMSTTSSTLLPTTTATSASDITTSASSPSPTQSGLSSSCDAFYYVKTGDSCWAIVNSYGNFTLNQFYSWNSAVKSDCSGLQPDYYVCIGVTGSTTVASQTTLPATNTASAVTTTGSYLPEQTGIASNCNKHYYVKHGDTCSDIAINYDISLSDFYSWNPAVGTTCSNLEADYWVCVGISGGTSATTTTPTSTSTSTASSTTPTSSAPYPTQSGLVDDCSTYYQAKSGDSCWSIVNNEYTYLTTSLFEEWNPAVGSDCSNLQPSYYYCVATQKQAPMPDTIDTCEKWHLVAEGDNCWSIEQDAGITADQFNTWNPYVGSSCANLWLGYWVCVGV